MSLGTLIPTLTLADPTHVHVGHHDPIRGHILLEYFPPTKTPRRELFAPVEIFLTLKCRLRVKYDPNNVRSSNEPHGVNAPLFETKRCVFSGPVQITKDYKFKHSFDFHFPRGIQERDDPLDLSCEWVRDTGVFDIDEEQALPSSKGVKGRRSGSEALFEYKLRVDAKVPDMDVTTSFGLMGEKGMTSAVVLYQQAPILRLVDGQQESQRGYVVTRLPKSFLNNDGKGETSQPGFFGKGAGAWFGSRPVFMLDCHLSVPTHFHLGQTVPLKIKVQHSERHREKQPQGTVMPSIQLLKAEVVVDTKLTSRSAKTTDVSWEGSTASFGVIEMIAKETVVHESGGSQRAGPSGVAIVPHESGEHDATRPPQFYKGNEYTQTVVFSDFTSLLSSTIKTLWIRQQYLMRIKCHILIGGIKEESFEKTFNVVVHPPTTQDIELQLLLAEQGRSATLALPSVAQSSGSGEGDVDHSEELPPYTP